MSACSSGQHNRHAFKTILRIWERQFSAVPGDLRIPFLAMVSKGLGTPGAAKVAPVFAMTLAWGPGTAKGPGFSTGGGTAAYGPGPFPFTVWGPGTAKDPFPIGGGALGGGPVGPFPCGGSAPGGGLVGGAGHEGRPPSRPG